ncbi:MAG: hypothetical protein CMI02_18060 [Oceanospirillaceae bacterium]|nr:hypothetical protein [Oceanospirillaceae bacterium]MBT13931.1 hypothetical protein [Oceanospirillaceae bacterium]|tara:strand:+ start:18307 stop:18768 length:462 start_codon:yes stop_codon:yes gene_type:complete
MMTEGLRHRSRTWLLIWLIVPLIFGTQSQAEEPETGLRQQLFSDLKEDSKTLARQLKNGEYDSAEITAAGLEQMVLSLRNLFPLSSKGEGRSRDKVWDNWQDFDQQLQDLAGDYRNIITGIRQQDESQIEQALQFSVSSCRACHRPFSYRTLW